MKKYLIFIFICILATSGFARIPRARTFNVLKKTQVSGMVTYEAMKAANKLRNAPKPPGLHISPFTTPLGPMIKPFSGKIKLDSLTSYNVHRLKPISTSRISEMEERLKRDYLEFKEKFAEGIFDTNPYKLLLWSSYADLKGDSDLSRLAYDKAKSEYLTVRNVLMYCSLGKDIPERRSELIRYVVEQDYVFGDEGLSQVTPDSVKNMYRQRLTELSEHYIPGMIPLIDIVYRSEDSDKLDPYRTAADSIISGASSFLPAIQDNIFSTLLHEFIEAGQYEEALAYFAKEPLSSYVESDAFDSLSLCDASLMLDDVSRFNHYLQCAFNVDSTVAQEYYDQYYKMCCDSVVEDPTDKELMDWILEVNDHPVELALSLTPDIMERHFPDSSETDSFEWCDMSQFTLEELEILKSVLYMGRTAYRMDNGRSDDLIRDLLIFNMAFIMTVDPTEIENATRHMDMLSDIAEKNPDPSYDDLRVLLIIGRTYIAAHGMDKPKEAYKILNKANKKVKSMILEPAVSMMYWQYLRAASEAIGKKGVVKRCDSVISEIQKGEKLNINSSIKF